MKYIYMILLLASALNAESISNLTNNHIYKKGEKVLPFTLESQHNKKYQLDDTTETILITYDKLSTALQNDFIRSKGGTGFLQSHHTLLIVDVSVIPSGILSLFVLPKMESFTHPLLLSYDENFSKMFPYKDAHIAVLKIEKSIVKKIMFCNDRECLEKVFAK